VTSLPEIVGLTARRQADLIRAEELSAVELVTAHLDRIEALNPAVNAIVSLDREGALRRAAAADAMPRDDRGPLHGLPIAIKDTAQTAGMRTTFGHPLFADNVPDVNDLHVERILRAGAILIGKTNVPELAAGSHTVNRVFGSTRNPHDRSRSAGGSSGGAAAALASYFVPIADGSDMGGSLRNPASFCNVVGFRPTPGAVPNTWEKDAFNPLATNGALGRNVSDVALLLSVIAQPSFGAAVDWTLAPRDLNGLRIAYAPDLGGRVPVAPEVADVIADTAAVLERAGCDVRLDCPDVDGSDSAFRTLRAAGFDAAWHAHLQADPHAFVDFLADNIAQGAALSSRDVMRAYAEITRLTQSATRFFDDYDAILAPVSTIAPFPVEWNWPKSVSSTVMHDYLDWMRASWLFTPLGIPGMSLPAGFTPTGLPVGAQLLAAPGHDLELLGIAQSLEHVLAIPGSDPLGGV